MGSGVRGYGFRALGSGPRDLGLGTRKTAVVLEFLSA